MKNIFYFLFLTIACRDKKTSSERDSATPDSPQNQSPIASIVSPAIGAEIVSGTDVELLATASDPDHATEELLGRWSTEQRDLCRDVTPNEQGEFECLAQLTESDSLVACCGSRRLASL